MQNISLKGSLIIFILGMMATGVARAQFEEGHASQQLNSISCTQPMPSVPNTVPYTKLTETSRKIRNLVRFKFNELATTGGAGTPFVYFKSPFMAVATLKVELWNSASTGGGSPDQTQTQTLTVNYDPAAGAKYNPIAYILLNPTGAFEQVRVTIDSVTITGLTNGWTNANVLPLLTVENEMDVIRYYSLSTSSSLLAPMNFSGTYDGVNHSDQVAVSWKFPSGANENQSQLEYAWVENETKPFYNVSGAFSSDLLFRTNSTRVDVEFKDTSYRYNVPLLFSADSSLGGGTLYYRVRPIVKKNDGSVIAGPWSTPQSVINPGHQGSLNWQVVTEFAEHGKSKTVVQYFDGSMRSRQTVAKDNSTGNTTVGETIYDLQGRTNVQIMPTPVNGTSVQYFGDFNRFAGQTANDNSHNPMQYFDLAVAGNQCVGAPALDKTRGNGQYFSSNNPWIGTEPSAKLIPDANGYGYSEVRYTDDITGRVSVQGGVGQANQIGSGHETKYYYGKPTQNELDALFGTEVGDASHYFKNMVQDANGQMNITYVDMHGRTIATALAGDTIAGRTMSINNNTSFYPVSSGRLTNNLLTAGSNVIKSNSSIESISTILVPSPTNYNFTYQLTPAILQMMDTAGHPVCFDCKYDLEISIRQEGCSGAAPVVKHFNNLQIQSAGQACTTPMGFTGDSVSTPTSQISFSVPLGTGSWVVRKTLTLDDSLFKVREDSAMKVFLAHSQQNIQDSIFAVMSGTSSCNVPAVTRDCSACQAQLGNYTTYKANYIASLGGTTSLTDAAIHAMYTQDSLACAEACSATVNPLSNPAMTTLGQLRAQLLADMVPFNGQYANKADTIADTSLTAKYNIFKTTYTGSFGAFGTKPFYKHPVTEPSGAAGFYTNPDGSADNSIYPNGTGDLTLLNSLADTTYTSMFARSWAGQLIYYHPEYQRLHFAETTMASSYGWLDSVMTCDSYSVASSRGYLTPLTSDPYFKFNGNTGYVPADRSQMNTYLTVSVDGHNDGNTIWRIANGQALVDTTLPGILRNRAMSTMSSTGISSSATTQAQQDAVWQAFRNEYLYYRNDMVVNYVNAQTASSLSAAAAGVLQNAKGKVLHFVNSQSNASQNGWSWWSSAVSGTVDSVTMSNQGNSYVGSHLYDPCAGQRPFWQARLMQCEQLQQFLLNQTQSDSAKVTTIINTILDSLVMVCHNSINVANPTGATNVNPAVMPTNPNNFEDIINHVFAQYGIVTVPGNNYFCNPYTVDAPKPYNTNPPTVVRTSTYIDSCGCGQFALVKSAAKVAGYDTTSLSSMNTYLRITYNDTLTTPVWQGLLRCNGYAFNRDTCLYSGLELPDTCFYYYRPIALGTTAVIPNFLACGYVQPCMTCTILQNYTLAFRSLYPAYAGVPYTGTLDTNMVRQNALWARYINFKSGFSLTASDYAAAYTSCNYSTSPSYLLLTNRGTQPPSGTQLPLLYTASDSVVFYQEYTSLDSDNFETLLASYSSSSGYAVCDLAKPVTSFPLPDTTHSNPCQGVREQADFIGIVIFQKRKDSLIANFDSLYRAKCLSAQSAEVFYATYQPSEYHYTLLYYDQAGNLVKTLPPAAVKPNFDPTYLAQVQAARAARTDLSNGTNIENMATQYRYNSLDKAIVQRSPDAGTSRFWYDRIGRLSVSQNAKQAADPSYSYTIYDPMGRITEIGQKPQNTVMTQTISQDTTALNNWLADITSGVKVQITRTFYDNAYPGFSGTAPLSQMNLRNRVAYSMIIDADNTNTVPYRAATFYSYNIHGLVDTVVQDYGTSSVMSTNGNRFKLIKYDYDLISGKINQTHYQPGMADAFYHQYAYDDENRLTTVKTSRDSILWQTDATYQYYRHGLTSRMQLGDLQNQGVDYAYTIQGWLKSVNPSWVNDGTGDLYDTDGTGTTPLFERDAYKFNLHYFDDGTYTDYKPVSPPTGYVQGNTLPLASKFNLYNGGISSMAVSLRKLVTTPAKDYAGALIYNYKYDQLNRIRSMDAWAANGSLIPTGSGPMQDYSERYAYDPNGNIMTLARNGTTGYGLALAMDNLTYRYAYVKTDGTTGEYIPGSAPTSGVDHLTNQLSSIGDIASTGYEDIKAQAPLHYHYDQIGNLINDSTSIITWSVYGKILSISNASGTTTYTYDAAGNRISKTSGGITTWYVYDVTGSVTATYVKGDATKNSGALTEVELNIYGKSRLGVLNLNVNCTSLIASVSSVWTRGSKYFELDNHMSNVLVTITDKKLQVSAAGATVDYYVADVSSASDYYPYGMQMPGRTYNTDNYRYGFDGQERSKELNNNTYTAMFWEYDARIAMRWNVDQKASMSVSGYLCLLGNPIGHVDFKGDSVIIPSWDYYAWLPLARENAGSYLFTKANARNKGHDEFRDQKMSDASGLEMNTDVYTLTIKRLPTNFANAGALLDYLRTTFQQYINGDVSTFEPRNDKEAKVWYSSDPSSAIMRFRGKLYGMNGDDADVITTHYVNTGDYAAWTFHPISDHSTWYFDSDKGHPLGGNREFGIQKDGSNYVFYIQGVDRLWSKLDELGMGKHNLIPSHNFFEMADNLWRQVMINVAARINQMGGEATFNADKVVSRRTPWGGVSEGDKKKIEMAGN